MIILNDLNNNQNIKNDIIGFEDKSNILKVMRRKCLASLIIKQRNEQVNDVSNFQNESGLDSSDLTESVIGNKSSKILKQLQARNTREKTGIIIKSLYLFFLLSNYVTNL
jgi:hypothetical protein